MLLKLVQRLDKNRFAVAIVVLSGHTKLAADLELAGADVVILGKPGWFGRLVGTLRVPRAVSRLRPDIVQGWMLHGNLAAQIAGCLSRIPVVWSVRHSRLTASNEKPLTRLLDSLMRHVSTLPVRIVYNSNEGRRHHERLGYDPSNSKVIPNGFDVVRFAIDDNARSHFRRVLDIGPNTVVIGMIARYHPIKDHSTFLQAASIVKQHWKNVRFVLVGSGCESRNAELREAVKRFQLAGCIDLLGERSDICSLANAFDIGVLSSSSEGFPNVIGELMACGVPCVVTDVGDSRWLVGTTGISVPPGEPKPLAQALDKMIRLGPNERRRLGHEARARIIDHFSLESVVHEFQSLYLDSILRKT